MNDLIKQIIKEEISRADRLQKYLDAVEEMVNDATTSDTIFIGQTPIDMAEEFAKKAFLDDDIYHPDDEDLNYVKQAALNALKNSGQIKTMNNKYNSMSGRYLPSGRFGMSFM